MAEEDILVHLLQLCDINFLIRYRDLGDPVVIEGKSTGKSFSSSLVIAEEVDSLRMGRRFFRTTRYEWDHYRLRNNYERRLVLASITGKGICGLCTRNMKCFVYGGWVE